MRLSILTLFIALPAAAYAVVSPRQPSVDSEAKCIPLASLAMGHFLAVKLYRLQR
jgi:hypothetical protein